MKKVKLKKALQKHYKKDMIKSIMCGRALPSLKNVIEMKSSHNIPLTAWADIRSYINNTKSKGTTTSLQKDVS